MPVERPKQIEIGEGKKGFFKHITGGKGEEEMKKPT